MKYEVNKKNKELHSLKIAFVKLDDENKKNIRILEEVIIEANKNRKKNMESIKYTAEDLENEIRNVLTYSSPSDKLLSKLIEVNYIFLLKFQSHTINSLKRQIFEYKTALQSKEEEIIGLKGNLRITKYQELDTKLKSTIDELIHLKENYTMIASLYNE